jgi:hypothetical protein
VGKPNSESLESLLRRCRIGIATLRPSGPDSPTQKIHREDRRSVSRGWEKGLLASFYFLAIWPRRRACSQASAGSRPVTCLYHAGWQDASRLYGQRVRLRSRGLLRGLQDIHTSKASTLRKTDPPIPWSTNCPPLRSISGHASTATPSCKIICWEFSSGAARQSSDSDAGRSRFPAERRISHRVECVPQGPRQPLSEPNCARLEMTPPKKSNLIRISNPF